MCWHRHREAERETVAITVWWADNNGIETHFLFAWMHAFSTRLIVVPMLCCGKHVLLQLGNKLYESISSYIIYYAIHSIIWRTVRRFSWFGLKLIPKPMTNVWERQPLPLLLMLQEYVLYVLSVVLCSYICCATHSTPLIALVVVVTQL